MQSIVYLCCSSPSSLLLMLLLLCRGRLQRLLSGLHVYVPRFRRRNAGPRLDGRFEECRWRVREERGKEEGEERFVPAHLLLLAFHSLARHRLIVFSLLLTVNLTALPREFKEPQYGHRDSFELWQTRPTCRVACHARSRNRPQLWLSGMFGRVVQSIFSLFVFFFFHIV